MRRDPKLYWSETMDQAYRFMQGLLAHPVEDCLEPLVDLPSAAAAAGVLIHFPEGMKLGQFERVYRMRESLVPMVLHVAEDMLRRDCVLRVEDAYRSVAVQEQGARSDFMFGTVLPKVIWELDGRWPSGELLFRRIAVLTATVPKFANHTSGSALDISVCRYPGGEEVDRGGPYLELSERTPMASPFISREARANREWILETMAAAGFLAYPYEFWHFSHGDVDYEFMCCRGRPARFGPVDWDPERNEITPVTDLLAPLLHPADVAAQLKAHRGELAVGDAGAGVPA